MTATDHVEIATRARVELIGWTTFRPPASLPDYEPEGNTGEDLVVFAGRACYQSFNRPRPETAGNLGYLANIIGHEHTSVMEHATATFYFSRVSRALTHELIRHRHFSYSQMSQRYVPQDGATKMLPEIIAGDSIALEVARHAMLVTDDAYEDLVERVATILADTDMPTLARRKIARESARRVLPEATESRIVVSGNITAWRHFMKVRATEGADREICDLAVQVLVELKKLYPGSFADYAIEQVSDGREIAVVERG